MRNNFLLRSVKHIISTNKNIAKVIFFLYKVLSSAFKRLSVSDKPPKGGTQN